MRWWWQKQPEARSISIADPTLAALFTPGGLTDLSGVSVGETSALGISAVYRALSLISGTLASLPLNSWRAADGGTREKVASIFDAPDGPDGQTVFEWKETLFLHQQLHGKAGALKVRNEAGGLVRLPLVHPLSFSVVQPTQEEAADPEKMPVGGVWFVITLDTGEQVRLDARDFWHAPGASLGGQVGMGLLQYARQSLGTTIAADRAAAKVFSTGALISGLATPDTEDGLGPDDIKSIRTELNRNVLGHENAGTIALVNRRLKFTPWTMTAEQAQFLQSRMFQIEEVARWTGVPPHLLMQTEKQTSWGTGVDEQNRGLSRYVLGHWASRMEQRASRLLARPRWCEFDFAGLERPNFETNVKLVLDQIAAKLISPKYGRELLNIPETAAPDEPETPQPAPPSGGEDDDDDPPAE